MKLYGEFDSLCKDQRSDYVFQVLCRELKYLYFFISTVKSGGKRKVAFSRTECF